MAAIPPVTLEMALSAAITAIGATVADWTTVFQQSVGGMVVGTLAAIAVAIIIKATAPLVTSVDGVKQEIAGQTAAVDQQTTELGKRADDLIKLQQEKSRLPRIKPMAPETFDGKAENVRNFLTALSMYFIAMDETDSGRQILFALSLMKGGKNNCASNWADAMRTQIADYNKITRIGALPTATAAEIAAMNTATIPFGTWDAFETALQSHFMLHTLQEAAQRKLGKLVMNSKTCEEYTTEFNGYALSAGFNETYLTVKYVEGLHPILRGKCIMATPVPKTLDAWKERALELDKAYRQMADKPESRKWEAKTQPTQVKDENAMDIDAIRTETKKKCTYCTKPGHTIDECRKKNGTCFKCGLKGHLADKCSGSATRTIRSTETSGGGASGIESIWEQIKNWTPDQQEQLVQKVGQGF